MKKVGLIFVMALSISALSAGVALADDCGCHSQLVTCDQGCQYIEDADAKLRCQNGCLSGYFHCLKRCDGRSEIITDEDFVPCGLEIVLSNCIEHNQPCTLYGTPCCGPYSCKGKFPNTRCE